VWARFSNVITWSFYLVLCSKVSWPPRCCSALFPSGAIWRPRLNKKLGEDLIAYFPLIRHEPHRKRRFQQFQDAAGMYLPSRCLATIRGYTDGPTDSPLLRHGPHTKRHVHKFFYCCVCIRCRGNVFTEPLPSNDKRQSDERDLWITPFRRAQVSCIHTRFRKDRCSHSKLDSEGYTRTRRSWWWSHKPTFIFSKWGKKAKYCIVRNFKPGTKSALLLLLACVMWHTRVLGKGVPIRCGLHKLSDEAVSRDW
jgi:hypothetical protein